MADVRRIQTKLKKRSDSKSFASALARDVVRVASAHSVPHKSLPEVEGMIQGHRDFFQNEKDAYVQMRLARKTLFSVHDEKANAGGLSKVSLAYKYQLNFRSEVFSPSRAPKLLRTKLANEDAKLSKNTENKKLLSNEEATIQEQLKFMRGLVDSCRTCAAAVDFDPNLGLCKLWHFGDCGVSQLAAVKGAPPAVAAHLPFFKKHGFNEVFCAGIDLTKQSMNIYFALYESGPKSVEDVVSIFRDFDLTPPAEAELKYISGPGSFTVTLRWGQIRPERICFYTIPHFSPLTEELRLFMKATSLPNFGTTGAKEHSAEGQRRGRDPGRHPENSKFVSISYACSNTDLISNTHGRKYFKQESDWNGNYYELLNRCGMFGQNPNSAIR